MPEWKYIIIHHTANTDNGKTMFYDNIVDLHVDQNKWQDIGYHFVVERIENRPVVLVGRGLDKAGAHAPGYNTKGIGIAFVGNYQHDEIDEGLIDVAMKRVILPMCMIYHIPADNILGHRDTKATLCPGTNLYAYLDKIRDSVRIYTAGGK